ncbi:unnamed protein product [Lymnaea stagnalis]|uniref:Uncharacterized protein n=1 Tax=Lymnaea stagnalis TaxID=6523 RepID=A0AAV2GYZ3_LYMST
MFLSGFSCLLVGWISTLQISLTSPLTYIVSTNSKSVFQTVLAVVWNSEIRSWLWWVGNGLVIVGIVGYTAIKLRSEQKKINMDIVVEEPKTDPTVREFVGESRSAGKRAVAKLSA